MLEILEDVIPRDYTYDPSWVFDRYKTIRSPEGYAGLRNLSNTCYLNSLFTQLFMNIDFRKFMLQVPAEETDPNQRLLVETKRLFAYMQNTWQKSVDTLPTVEAIRTFENEMIDITIQMDVDEFYNLLFDRWEGQIQSTEDKKAFRSFYGGQLVQQIKSKECEHISERVEPFSAIQCDIKGKSGLEDSLRAYVEGEMMQGDNKYSCTSCNRHVDAVKRACLKDIPDNLIFHLKRFDFDVSSMMRSKINDEFHFPERIDMAPFKVEHLSNADAPVEADIFELVGVLVHSGTAESGHYYSYIKERPSRNFGSWVEFNDADVSRFDPSKIPDLCFGGINDPYHGPNLGPVRFNKVWNAYMLFYQRVFSMEVAQSEYKLSLTDTPVTIPLPLELGNHIAMENELFLRAYCLLDPNHTRFILGLVQLCRKAVLSGGAKNSKLQKAAVYVALDALDQLVSRTKEALALEQLFAELDLATEENPYAAFWVLEWTANRRFGIRNLLLKCPNTVIRAGFSALLISSLARLKDRLADPTLEPVRATRYSQEYTILLENILTNLHHLWSGIHLYYRAWDDYFELILSIAKFGEFEVEVILDHGFMLKCLEIIWLDKEDRRKFSLFKLMELLYLLFNYIDWSLPPSAEMQQRTNQNGKFSMSVDEADLICPLGRHKELAIVRKIIEQQANPARSSCHSLKQHWCSKYKIIRSDRMTPGSGVLCLNALQNGVLAFSYLRIRRFELVHTSSCNNSYFQRKTKSCQNRIVTITLVVNHCTETYFDENENEEDLEFLQQASSILASVGQMTVDVPEEFISDAWEDNSMMGSDSDIGFAGSP
ncbi:ubiquitin carboxyl-terminal hydrolase 24 [Coccidioides immitis H538.4]|uniref:Ubiquitin carboxyl-terminal hydrolase 24 n=1 Tax=Coccidioides immitis H538.4 TaxID=396776 RepID=A0A0J8RJR5_COCIT|nr:ubiquitin carboxyl-terminal hydrolase 24 [Coccidioides immitis H538.4]